MKKLTLIFWLIFIFILSNMNASDSDKLSLFIVDLFGLNHSYGNLIIRKLAHAFEFFILGLLIFRITKGKTITLLLPILCACLDEFHQFFIPGRFMFYGDIIIDSTGILCSFLLYKYYSYVLNRNIS